MSRRLARLTLDNLGDVPLGCRSCTFWELDPVRRQRAVDAGESCGEKEAWVSRVLLEWGSCGRVAYVDDDPAGYVLYAPPVYLPGADAFPTAPVSEDAVLLATAMVYPEYAGSGLGRVLMQTVVKDLVKRGGIRAVEAFGDTRAAPRAQQGRPGTGDLRDLRAAGGLPAAGRASRPTGRTRATPGCGSSSSRRSPGATRWRARWSGCWAPYDRRGTRPPTRRTASSDGGP